jgi:hypothetical protein
MQRCESRRKIAYAVTRLTSIAPSYRESQILSTGIHAGHSRIFRVPDFVGERPRVSRTVQNGHIQIFKFVC